MDECKSFSFDGFKNCNPDKKITTANYIHMIFHSYDLNIDIIICFIDFIYPKLIVHDDVIFIEELFDENRYNDIMMSKDSNKIAQFWINLVEITGVFDKDEIEYDDLLKISNFISMMWNINIINSGHEGKGRSRVIEDYDTGEIFITID